MRILMVAPPGAGKGTQADRLAKHYGIEHLASGEMLRDELAAHTDLGERVRPYVERGDLVPDDLVMRLVLDRLAAAADRGGYVLDGFPRTVKQAETAYEEAKRHTAEGTDPRLQAVVHLKVGRAELRRRMKARAEDEGRSDDTDSVIEHRLDVYEEMTEPLLRFYRDRNLLISVNGEGSIDEISAELFDALDHLAQSDDGSAHSGGQPVGVLPRAGVAFGLDHAVDD
jgi:adenylate kinase